MGKALPTITGVLSAACIVMIAPSAAYARDSGRDLEAATATLKERTAAWANCLSTSSRRYNATGAAIELVVSAAFGDCTDQELDVKIATLPVWGLTHLSSATVASAEDGAIVETLAARNRFREQMIGVLLLLRAKP
ncbi:MAG: hypothetical protein ABI240_01805 [Sphingomonas sp.]